MRVLITGASGLVGRALTRALEARGDAVVAAVRGTVSPADAARRLQWDPQRGFAPGALQGFDAVVHLAGETVAGRWSAEKKRRIRDSRVEGTR
ncbi:MAG: NAD-dependent epimerase/dehydratase family protein, partial [Myxococcales bacterium]|nr:NAD-dependent epimerase/dehydratase family protein [Myxococcales bacterium]